MIRPLFIFLLTLLPIFGQVPRVLVRVHLEVKDDLAYAPSSDRISEEEIERAVQKELQRKGYQTVGYSDLNDPEIKKELREKKIGVQVLIRVMERNRRWESVGKNYDVFLEGSVLVVNYDTTLWNQVFSVSASRSSWPNSTVKAQREFLKAFPYPNLEEVLGLRVLGEVFQVEAPRIWCKNPLEGGTRVAIYYPGRDLVHPISGKITKAPSIKVAEGIVVQSDSKGSEIRLNQVYLHVQVGNQIRKLVP